MTPERFRQIEEVFHAAADAPAEERSDVLDRLCSGDTGGSRAEVETLLDASRGAQEQIQGVIGREAGQMMGLSRLFAGRFEIEHEAGRGGMGAVYRARDRTTGAAVALKLTHPSGSIGRQASLRFTREARLLAEIVHPGIVSYVAHGEAEDGRLYLAMEWLDGEDLAARLARGALPLHESFDLVRRVASALDAAHQKGVVHRDLKPSNLFLVGGAVTRIKLLDFGVARRTLASRAMTRTGTVIGTPDYMAPEQVRGRREITPAADVFSLGCVLYQCLTGRPPFAADHIAAVLARIIFDDPPPVEQVRNDVPAPLSALLRRMLAKDPEQRFAGAGALREALDALGDTGFTHGSPGSGVTIEGMARPSGAEIGVATTVPDPPVPAPFAEHEQRLLSLVVAWPPLRAGGLAMLGSDDDLADAARRSDVRSALSAMGLVADFMADGSLVVKVLGSGSATDQVAHAARAALVIKERWPMATVALATGRGTLEGAFTIGEVADRAVRLLTGPDSSPDSRPGVRVDELSARLLGSRFALTPSPEGAILIGREKDADVSRPLLGKPTPCVGREAELSSLEAQLASCIEEAEARAVLVTAPPGAGKSRLRHELLRRIERKGEPVTRIEGHGDAVSAGTPYGILAAAIRTLSGIDGDEPLQERQSLLRARVGQHVLEPERERVVRFVGELCSVPFSHDGMPMLQTARHEPKIMGDCLRRAFLDFVAAECAAGPVLVVLDDLQWGDALTVSALDEALREQAGAPLFVLALARPEVHKAFPRLWHRHKVQEIALRGLSKKACERLIREVLGKAVPAEVLDRAVDQSAGNALFLEELIRAIAEGKGAEQPETMVAMLQARIGRLPRGPRRALQAASMFGHTFWTGGVARVLGLPPASPEVTGWLSALVEEELIQSSATSRLQGEKEHAFRHALVRDAAYGLLTVGDVATGHRLAGEFLEAAGEHDAAIVADHFERGGASERAAAFHLRAAEESLQRGDYAGARRQVDRGLGCAPEGEVLGRLKSVVCAAAVFLDTYEGTSDAARAAMTLLRPGSLGWCRAILASIYADIGDPTRSVELLSQLDSTEPDPDARIAHIEAQTYVSVIMARAAPERTVRAHLERLASCIDSASETFPAVRRYLLFARSHATVWRYPRPWSAMVDYHQGLRLAQEVADQKIELLLRLAVIETAWLEMGDLDGARRRMLAMEEKLSQSQEMLLFGLWARLLLRILCEVPDEKAWSQAEALMERLLSDPNGMLLSRLSAQAGLARVALVRGQLEKAEELSRAAMALLPLVPIGWINAAPAHIRALIGLGRAGEACLVAEQVLGVLTTYGGAGSFEVEARLAVVDAFEESGDQARARTELAETLRQVALRADDIVEPLWKESYLTRNPYVARAMALGRDWDLSR